MSKYFKETSDSEEIMQGDIIRAKSQDFSTQDHLGVIITADCDIFQKKSNDTLTYLKILHLEDYVNEAWAIKQQKKMREKQENPICEQINAKLRKSGKDLSPITHESLKEWLKHHEPEKITEKICEHDGHNKEEILEKLKGYKLLTIEEDFNLKKLQEAWDLFKVKERKQKEELRKISSSGAFEDFFFCRNYQALKNLALS
ncbi:hypothetical protein [Chromohalobacter israelensis]|uniref:hypothetical protein n=1 Tax=Chromohalobacter israelensis TaxID=141390 RepID=UPI00265B96EA|nr:hypothetical protein [Chromohalobacter salexigens]MDO0944174.1 hypothetical protein [Chromohalobacter salexigens]